MKATKAMTLLAAIAVGFSAQALTLAVKDVNPEIRLAVTMRFVE